MPGLPHHRSIPAAMPAHLAPAVAQGHNAKVRFRHPDQVVSRNTTTGKETVTAQTPYYDGPARVQEHSGSGPDAEGSGRQVAVGSYLVGLPYTVTQARPNDLGEVYESEEDPGLVGVQLIVEDVSAASIILQRTLSCLRYQGAVRTS